MIELSIQFSSDEKDDASLIHVRLFRPDTGSWTDPVGFEPPLDDRVLAELRWYLELFSTWPTGPDYERAERIEGQMEDWGRALLESVTPDRESVRVWSDFAGREARGKLVTIDAVDPRVLRLPWELLADEGGHLFSAGVGVRRRLKRITGGELQPFELPVRLLVVVSRPQGARLIDPRAVSRPLLDALEALGERAVTEFLYPPTLKALSDRLRDRTAPSVHVLHFDGHGAYDAHTGMGYLLFEKEKHDLDQVDANRLGTLLNRCGVPLMVLNACQSAAQEEANPYASVAARLIRAGVGSVLAMNYSVEVEAVRKFVEAFYRGLASGLSVGQAVDEGRCALLADEARGTVYRRDGSGRLAPQTVTLRDWFLPALYQQAADPLVFAPQTSEVLETSEVSRVPRALADPSAPGGLPAQPRHGFHGRAREMLELERALAEWSVVVLHGFGGTGKTALAAEAGRWFHRTGRFPGGAAFVSFEHGGSLDQLCSWVAQAVSGEPDYLLHADDPPAAVADLLGREPALVILDNFESVVGPNPLMPPEELRAVLDAVWAWSGKGASRVLITTRDTVFSDVRFAPSTRCTHVPLSGLTTPDALRLAAAVLDDHRIDRARIPRRELADLMAHLGGHPLSLYLVLPHLRDHTPAELTEHFEDLLPGFTQGEAAERNESLEVSLDFSLRRLGEGTRAALPDLAVFQGGALESQLLAITGMDEGLWRAARAELEAAALITAESLPGVTPPFLRFHPTLAPYLAPRLDPERRVELETRYWREYYATARELYHLDTQHPHQARAVALRELPNLRRALYLCLGAMHLEGALHGTEAVDFAYSVARFLDIFGRWRELDAMKERVSDLISNIPGEEGLTKAQYLLQRWHGETLMQRGQAAAAERLFRRLLERMEAGMAYAGFDADYDRAFTRLNLGISLERQGRHRSSIPFKESALHEFEGQSSNEAARGMLGNCYHHIANSQLALGDLDGARANYEEAIGIFRREGAQRDVAMSSAQLGLLALQRGELDEARRRYTDALETSRELGEPRGEAKAWHQLGAVAQEKAEHGLAKEWDEAERCYREALRIFEQLCDLPMLAATCNQLGIVAEGTGRPDDAERWYLRALELKDQVAWHDATTLDNLADLYLSQGRLDEAATCASRALEIKEEPDLSADPWKTYHILGRIAEARGHADEAARWRRKGHESFAASAGAAHEVRQYQPLIEAILAACQGNEEAQQQAEAALEHMASLDQVNRRFAQAARRILAGERDAEVLTQDLEYIGAAIVRTILTRLSGPVLSAVEGTTPTPDRPTGGEVAISLADLFTIVARACRPDAPPGLGEQFHALTHQLSRSPDQPAEIRALGRVLNRVLSGDRDPDLSDLPPALAEAVGRLLETI